MLVLCIQIKHKRGICPFTLKNVTGLSNILNCMSSHFSYKFRFEVVFMVSFWFALVHKIISMACILNKMQKQLRPQRTTPTLDYLCEQRNGCVMAQALTRQPLPTKHWT